MRRMNGWMGMAAIWVMATPALAQEGPWGAIAIDKRHSAHAEVHNYATRAAAEAEAKRSADSMGPGFRSEIIMTWAGKGCGTYVAQIQAHPGAPNSFEADGWGGGPNLFAAQAAADKDFAASGAKGSWGRRIDGCNTEGTAPFNLVFSAPKANPSDCLIQYELQLDDSGDNWKTRIYSPVYRLRRADCPLAGTSQYAGYTTVRYDDGRLDHRSNGLGASEAAKLARGFVLTDAFMTWLQAHRAPVPGLHYRTAASIAVSTPTAQNIADLTEEVGGHDSGDSAGLGDGLCIDYAPEGVTPVAVLGADRCRRWAR